jgi:hypothetical protein
MADNDEDADMDPKVADEMMGMQKNYMSELKNKFKRKKSGKATAEDADFEEPTKEEMNEMMLQTMKLKKQKKAAKKRQKDLEEL